jgi:tetratricopeptide (TPR) repeat protein
VYYLKGRNQRLIGDSAAAISSYQTAIEINPDLERAHLELGVMMASAGQEAGLRYLDNVLELNDSNRIARYQMAKYQQDFGDITLAVEAYEAIIRRDPQDGDALYNLGTIWFGADSLEKALRLFDLTTKVEPARAMAYYAKGLAASELGRNEEALRYLRQAINLQPDLEPALDLLASLSVSQP